MVRDADRLRGATTSRNVLTRADRTVPAAG
jgi:hypothetical protein